MVSVKSFFGDVSTPSSLPSALPKTVAVFRAHLKLEVVAGGQGGERRRDAQHCQSPAACEQEAALQGKEQRLGSMLSIS